MPIKFRCPNGHLLQARDDKAGKQMRCPACKQIVTVPEPVVVPRSAASQQASTSAKSNQQTKEKTRRPTASKSVSPATPVSPANKAKKKPTPRPAPPSSQPKTTAAPKQGQPQPTPHRPPPLPKQPSAAPAGQKPQGPPPLKHPDPKAASKANQPVQPAAAKSVSTPHQAATTKPSQPKPTESPAANTTLPPRPAATEAKTAAPESQPQAATNPSVAEAWSVAPPPVQAPARGIRRWFAFEPGGRGYLPDQGKVTSVRWLALALAAIAVIGAMPARSYYYFAGAPAWAQVVLLISVVQLVYILWMASLPDWSTVWVTMIVFAVTSAIYGFALAVTLLTPVGRGLPLNLAQVHRIAPAWCGAMVLFTFLGAFMCGRYSFKWYKTYVLTARE